MEDFKQDVGKWHRLNSSDLTPFVEEEVKHLSEHMQKTYVEAQQALEAESQELKSLKAEKIKIVNAIDLPTMHLLMLMNIMRRPRQ